MPWDITWRDDTRERLVTLARQHWPYFPLGDIGPLIVSQVEKDLTLHPVPGEDLSQYAEDSVIDMAGIQVHFHIDSARRAAEILQVTSRA